MNTFLDHLHLRDYVTRPELLADGYDDEDIRGARRQGHLHTIGPGLYASRNFPTLTAEHQHLIRCHARSSRFHGAVAVSHQSAALLHGAAIWEQDLSKIHVTRLDAGRGRQESGVAHHVGSLLEAEVTEVSGLLVTTAARTAWDVATTSSLESSLVTIDSLLRQGTILDLELRACVRRNSSCRGARGAKLALSLASELAESPGETRSRLLFRQAGLPRPELQYRVADDDGRLIGITDFAWPKYRLLGEFDGRIKYQDPGDLFREKNREDQLRSQGWGMVRLVWSDLATSRRRATANRVREALERSAQSYAHLVA